MSKKDDIVCNLSNGPWGYDPEPDKHEAFLGWRGIWCPKTRTTGVTTKARIDYLLDRSSCNGKRSVLNKLLKWWNKRGGVESLWLNSNDKDAQPWIYKDAEQGNIAYVRKADGYVYITLYHDTVESSK